MQSTKIKKVAGSEGGRQRKMNGRCTSKTSHEGQAGKRGNVHRQQLNGKKETDEITIRHNSMRTEADRIWRIQSPDRRPKPWNSGGQKAGEDDTDPLVAVLIDEIDSLCSLKHEARGQIDNKRTDSWGDP